MESESSAPVVPVSYSNNENFQNPSATVSKTVPFDNVHVLPQTPQLIALLTVIRNKDTQRADFVFYSNRIIRLLVEEGLNHLPVVSHDVTTPVGRTYSGLMFQGKICGVSIMRAGEAMEQGLRDCCRSVRIGKILIQRDEETAEPKLFYDKLPDDINKRWVLLLDPMFATGGSAIMAVEVLKSRGVPEERILFLNLIASPKGVENFATKFPKLRVVTAFIDEGLDEKNYIVPGLGDFGDRFYTL
ncbi:Uracil phosphoribosyltransferase, synthesizes UMP from uracil [Ceratocystis pirilliformis]|uniref:uracil phosphoribosyltransferase n=3 Tax=Ceratocystis TaxID=5157 RepID=A0A2C5X160_9PEZI|nr:Uracil phosphoribosyltransferase [Ceratocystis fimbriata CBS 114723]